MNEIELIKPNIFASLAYLENNNINTEAINENNNNNINTEAINENNNNNNNINSEAINENNNNNINSEAINENNNINTEIINENIKNNIVDIDDIEDIEDNKDIKNIKDNKDIVKIEDNKDNKIYKDYKEKDDINDSCALDIIAVYLKGQKNIYMESKLYCQQILNILMLPAIFISALASVLSLSFVDFEFNPILISSLNGFNTFLLSLISYLKLDAKAEAHRMSSDKFDNLQSQCEFKSGQVLLFDMIDKKKNLNKFLEMIEKEVIEIKSTNQFIIPEKIRNKYLYTYSTNVFTLVKEIIIEQKIKKQEIDSITKIIKNYINDIIEKQKYEIIIIDLQKEKNNILLYQNKMNTDEKQIMYNETLNNINHQQNIYNNKINNIIDKLKYLEDINLLKNKKNKLIDKYLKHTKKYMEIDKRFKDEIELNINNTCNFCQWLKT